jgi:hypothetical protein
MEPGWVGGWVGGLGEGGRGGGGAAKATTATTKGMEAVEGGRGPPQGDGFSIALACTALNVCPLHVSGHVVWSRGPGGPRPPHASPPLASTPNGRCSNVDLCGHRDTVAHEGQAVVLTVVGTETQLHMRGRQSC